MITAVPNSYLRLYVTPAVIPLIVYSLWLIQLIRNVDYYLTVAASGDLHVAKTCVGGG